jgi:hypothetical protein
MKNLEHNLPKKVYLTLNEIEAPSVNVPSDIRVYRAIHQVADLLQGSGLPVDQKLVRNNTNTHLLRNGYWDYPGSIRSQRGFEQYLRDIRFFYRDTYPQFVKLIESQPDLIENVEDLLQTSEKPNQEWVGQYICGRFDVDIDNVDTMTLPHWDHNSPSIERIREYQRMFKSLMPNQEFRAFVIGLDSYRALYAVQQLAAIPVDMTPEVRLGLRQMARTGDLRAILSSPLGSRNAEQLLHLRLELDQEQERLRHLRSLQASYSLIEARNVYDYVIHELEKKLKVLEYQIHKGEETITNSVDILFLKWDIMDPDLKKRSKRTVIKVTPLNTRKRENQLHGFHKRMETEERDATERRLRLIRQRLLNEAGRRDKNELFTNLSDRELELFPEARLLFNIERIEDGQIQPQIIAQSAEEMRWVINNLALLAIPRDDLITEGPKVVDRSQKPPLMQIILEEPIKRDRASRESQKRIMVVQYYINSSNNPTVHHIRIDSDYRSDEEETKRHLAGLPSRKMNHSTCEIEISDGKTIISFENYRVDNSFSRQQIILDQNVSGLLTAVTYRTSRKRAEGVNSDQVLYATINSKTGKVDSISATQERRTHFPDLVNIIHLFQGYIELLP